VEETSHGAARFSGSIRYREQGGNRRRESAGIHEVEEAVCNAVGKNAGPESYPEYQKILAFEIWPICPDLSGDRPGTLASRTTRIFWQFIQNNQGMRSQICLAGHPDFPSHAARIAWPAEPRRFWAAWSQACSCGARCYRCRSAQNTVTTKLAFISYVNIIS
jgi:hypothetical protein